MVGVVAVRLTFEEFDRMYPLQFRKMWPSVRRAPRSRPRLEDEIRALSAVVCEAVNKAEALGEYRWLGKRRVRICR